LSFRRLPLPTRAFLFSAALCALISCGKKEQGPSVLLVTLDTTRADYLGAYGRPDARTPEFDQLARRGVLFETAIADVPVTLPSHATILTGIPALGHGVRYNADFKLGDGAITLAEVFREAGFATGAVVTSFVLDSQFGIAQGFDFYQDDLKPGIVIYDSTRYTPELMPALRKSHRGAVEAIDLAMGWMRENRKKPFFFWLHLYDNHYPYDPPPPWGKASADPYISEIQFTDRQLHRFRVFLEAEGIAPHLSTIVTADHGEGLDQHREDGHGIFVYDEVVRVPLLVRSNEVNPAGRVIPSLVRSIDVAPTILELAGQNEREIGVGKSLVPAMRGTGGLPDSVGYSESIKTKLFYSGSGLKAVRTRDTKFIWAPQPELYDLRNDPGETHNLLAGQADSPLLFDYRNELEKRIRDILGRSLTSVEAANPDEQAKEQLQSLGYVSGSSGELKPGTLEQEMALEGFDPKDLVDVSMGAREIQKGFYDRGEEKLQRFFRTAPSPEARPELKRLWAAAHLNYAKIWMVRENYREAANEYDRALAIDPEYDAAAWSKIYALNLAKDYDAAEQTAAARLATHPEAWKVRLHRAFALSLAGRRAEASAELETILRGAPPNHEAARGAGIFLRSLGTPQEARALETYVHSAKPGTSGVDASVD
jgi:arylsulfatase A-like enzyme